MKLQNSYIFLKQTNSDSKNSASNNHHINLNDSLLFRLETMFPNIQKIGPLTLFEKKEYFTSFAFSTFTAQLNFTFSNVAEMVFLDVSVSGNTIVQCIKAMEYVHAKLLTDKFTNGLIPIISYDAVSEYFCNKAFPMLNTLERNLRKLLLNTYVFHFAKTGINSNDEWLFIFQQDILMDFLQI